MMFVYCKHTCGVIERQAAVNNIIWPQTEGVISERSDAIVPVYTAHTNTESETVAHMTSARYLSTVLNKPAVNYDSSFR